jgi:hypothetical protein
MIFIVYNSNMSLMNEKTTLFLESMDKKYEEQTRNWTEQSNQGLIHRLKEMDKKYQKYYSSIHYSGRDFTDVFHYTYESLNPNEYYDETYELKKKEQKEQKEQNAEKTKKEKKRKSVPLFQPFKNKGQYRSRNYKHSRFDRTRRKI